MNLDTLSISNDLIAGIKSIPPSDLARFIESAVKQECEKLGELSDEDLTALQTRVKLFKEIGFTLAQLQKRKVN